MVSRPKTIGFFIGSTEDSYGKALVKGAQEAASAAGVRLLCFTSGTLRSYHGFEAQRNVLYDLVDAKDLDALILSGSLSHNASVEDVLALVARYAPLPIVSLAVKIPGMPCVVTENRPGMEALMDHLLKDHGYNRLAFIGGPPGQQEAEIRKEVFQSALLNRGIEINPSWVVHGDYTRLSGAEAMEGLLNLGPLDFQGVVAANDSMALGAQEVLQSRGISVPDRVFITGFDDMAESRFAIPALTTVRQSAYQQARAAVMVILDQWKGSALPEVVNLPPALILRRSCGCRRSSSGDLSHTGALLPPDLGPGWISSLKKSMIDDLQGRGDFLGELEKILQRNTEGDLGPRWQKVLSGLRMDVENLHPDLGKGAEDLWNEARILVNEISLIRDAQIQFKSELQAEVFRETSEALITSHNLKNSLDVLAWDLPRLGFYSCYLSVFEDPKNPAGMSRLLLAYDRKGRWELPEDGLQFSSRDLIPGGLGAEDPCGLLLVTEALYSKDERLGFMILGTDLLGTEICGTLRSQVSGALQGVLLLEQRRKALEELHQSQLILELHQKELEEKNRDLSQALENLENTQQQLILSEKMAALGNLVAGVAHEINTPLGVALTASSFLADQSEDFSKEVESGTLKKSDLIKYLKAAKESGALIQSNLSRAADLVQSFKRVAADQSSEERRLFSLREYLENLIPTLHPQWKNRPIRVDITGEPELKIDSFPGAVAQIVTNLLINSLVHGFYQGQAGHISIDIKDRGDFAAVDFQDDGVGIAQENLSRIFDPFFTTRRGQGGTGLGLNIVYNLVNHLLGGTIVCESALGKGTLFRIRLPKKAPEVGTK